MSKLTPNTGAPGLLAPRLPGDVGSALDERALAPDVADLRHSGAVALASTGANGGTAGGGDGDGTVPEIIPQTHEVAWATGASSVPGASVSGVSVGQVPDGSRTAFTLSYTPSDGKVQVFLNGQRLRQDGTLGHYTVSGAVVTFNSTYVPAATDELDFEYWRDS